MATNSLTLAGFALQALLARHEAFLLEAEEERNAMSASIRRLETEKEELESANSSKIKENRNLLDQLENMNNSIAESDTHIRSLTATLASTRSEIERLTVLAARTTQLESQLSAIEAEQLVLRENLVVKEESHRTAVQRWKMAERTVGHLNEQVDRIEREAKDERQRHADVVGRLERRRVVELELETAAGRLKGAAAATSLEKDSGSSTVVSHFVKDILQDNANLQMGIVELRDMLMGSNAEIENLREQMLEHQPISQSVCSPLEDELAELPTKTTKPDSHPELHVHHHYHAPSRAEGGSRERFGTPRRPKKKRNVLMPGVFTPPSSVRTTRTAGTSTPSSAAAILAQTSVTIPPLTLTQSAGWSLQSPRTRSSVAASTVPSSPQSAYGPHSLFDHVDNTLDTSRPTSPESLASESPFRQAMLGKRNSSTSQRSFSTPIIARSQSPASPGIPSNPSEYGKLRANPIDDGLSEIDTHYFDHATIIEENEDESMEVSIMAGPQPLTTSDPEDPPLQSYSPRLRRPASHESILSPTSPDIPTLRTQHTRLLASGQGLKSRTSLSITTPRIEPVINSMSASAEPSLNSTSHGQDSKSYNRSILSGMSSHSEDGPEKQMTLGKRVGGWVWGKWGIAPMASTGNLRAKASLNGALGDGGKMRAAGVNQVGKVRGLGMPRRVPSKVEVEGIDERALREVLDEE
ncbi:MAG: hypothetical protein HETSPECPRED_001250 [Heterodermia speciosa]|uniref:NUDE domain-containing protein n=1 Tax=Heterodermia speciosa TaxID=116794 RepID=A0A8H3ET12_9LECA|nr:MAG: hypothetical protein HETSPECPRED_001250 [Heterodermia speciosa]